MLYSSDVQRQQPSGPPPPETAPSGEISIAAANPIERIGPLIAQLGVGDDDRQTWNRLVGAASNAANSGKADRVRTLLGDAQRQLHRCVVGTIGGALDLPPEDIDDAFKAGYTATDIFAVSEGEHGDAVRRAAALAELERIVVDVRGMGMAQVRRAATLAAGALNAGQLKQGLDQRAYQHCERLLATHVRSIGEFMAILRMGEVRSQLRTSPELLAEALRRFGNLSVHFLGHDTARTANRDDFHFLLEAGQTLAPQMTSLHTVTVLESLRQLSGDEDNDVESSRDFLGAVARRCLEATRDPNDAVAALYAAGRARLLHPDVVVMARGLLQRIAAAAGEVGAPRVAMFVEAWRRAGIPIEPADAAAFETLLRRAADDISSLPDDKVVPALYDVSELNCVRTTPGGQRYIAALSMRGAPLAGTMQTQDVVRSIRSMGLTQSDGSDQRVFIDSLGRRGATLIADPRTRPLFGQREVGFSLLGIGDIARGHAQRRINHAYPEDHYKFIDGLASRATEVDHDVITGSSSFVTFAHVDYRSPHVDYMLQQLARTGPKWATAGSDTDCERRQNECYWAVARMGLTDEQATQFAAFLAKQCVRRLPGMNLRSVARHLWSSMVIKHLHPDLLDDDLVQPALARADELIDALPAGDIPSSDAMQMYHAQTFLRGKAHPRCTEVCLGDAEQWVATGMLPKRMRKHRDVQPDATTSAAEQHVWRHVRERCGDAAQHDILHHGFGLDIAIRVPETEGQKPYLLDVEIDGTVHQNARQVHTDRLRDKLLGEHFNTRVLRLPFTAQFDKLTDALDKELTKLAL